MNRSSVQTWLIVCAGGLLLMGQEPGQAGLNGMWPSTLGGAADTLPGSLSSASGEPTVSWVSPSSGEQASSLAVTISGSSFTGATAVGFGTGITVTSFTVDSDTRITASITIDQAAALGGRDVTVTIPLFGTATRANGFVVTTGAASVSSVSPSSGEQAQSLTVTIYGANFNGATAVCVAAGQDKRRRVCRRIQ